VLTAAGNNFNDFPKNQLPKLQQIGTAPPYQISDWYGGQHTCHTASLHKLHDSSTNKCTASIGLFI